MINFGKKNKFRFNVINAEFIVMYLELANLNINKNINFKLCNNLYMYIK
jgi:hypothetical protein